MLQRTLKILPQPDERTCGPTCLHAIYSFDGDAPPLMEIIDDIEQLAEGGTLGVQLAHHAQLRGYSACIYTYNLQLFDPTWMRGDTDIAAKLRSQARRKRGIKLRRATTLYETFLASGGDLRHTELTAGFIAGLLAKGRPVIAGLSATYLYDCARENDDHYDDVGGTPVGHFVVLESFDEESHTVRIADPFANNPGFRSTRYEVDARRLINSILLGVVTYDANLIVLEKNP